MKRPGALLAVILATAAVLTGCLVIPVNYHASGSRRNIDDTTANTLAIGVTTRREALLRLGEPEHSSEDDRHLGYRWGKVKAVWFVAAGYAVAGGEVVRDQVLEIWFDQTGLLTDVQVTTSWGGPPSIGPEGSVRGAPPGA